MAVWPFKMTQKQTKYPPGDVYFLHHEANSTADQNLECYYHHGAVATMFNKRKQACKNNAQYFFSWGEKHQRTQAKEEAALVTGR